MILAKKKIASPKFLQSISQAITIIPMTDWRMRHAKEVEG